MILQQIVNGIVVGSVYGLFALGFTLIFGVKHVMNLAHGALFMWGAFAGYYSVALLGAPFVLALAIGAVAGGLLSIILYWTAFRPLRGKRGVEFSAIVSSIGAAQILTSIAQQVSQTQVLRFPFDVFPIVVFRVLDVRIQLVQIMVVLVSIATLVLLLVYVYGTRHGRNIRAVAFSEDTAQLLGINPNRANLQVFFLSGALAGLAGVLIGLAFNAVDFTMGESFLLLGFVVVILGGLGSIVGSLVASLLIGILQTLSVAYFSAGITDAVVFIILFLILLVRPTGLFGSQVTTSRVPRR